MLVKEFVSILWSSLVKYIIEVKNQSIEQSLVLYGIFKYGAFEKINDTIELPSILGSSEVEFTKQMVALVDQGTASSAEVI